MDVYQSLAKFSKVLQNKDLSAIEIYEGLHVFLNELNEILFHQRYHTKTQVDGWHRWQHKHPRQPGRLTKFRKFLQQVQSACTLSFTGQRITCTEFNIFETVQV